MTEFAADYAAADLDPLEEGALRALASIGWNPHVAEIRVFCEGFTDQTYVPAADVRAALLALDALGWAKPNGEPLHSTEWWITEQGRIALERRP